MNTAFELDTALLVAFLFGAATWLILQKSFVRILFGFIVLSNAANLLILAMSGDPQGKEPPITVPGASNMVDPLPQALVLTAIVIGFGVTAYLIFLLYRIFLDHETANQAGLYRRKKEDAS